VLTKRWVCICEEPECKGKAWLPREGMSDPPFQHELPDQCPRCKSRKWNKSSEVAKAPLVNVPQLGNGTEPVVVVEAVPVVTIQPDQTPEQKLVADRKLKKELRHAELKRDAQRAVEAEGIPPDFMKRVNTPAVGHHVNCTCMRCKGAR
jgi:hypothetical protein